MTRIVQKITVALSVENGLDPIIQLPEGAHFLTLRGQDYDEQFQLNHPNAIIFDTWWGVETDNALVDTQLHVRRTDQEVPPSVTYLGSVFPMWFEFHVWQKDLVFQDMHIVDGKFVPRSQ